MTEQSVLSRLRRGRVKVTPTVLDPQAEIVLLRGLVEELTYQRDTARGMAAEALVKVNELQGEYAELERALGLNEGGA